jgi:site-specific DNA recombinase
MDNMIPNSDAEGSDVKSQHNQPETDGISPIAQKCDTPPSAPLAKVKRSRQQIQQERDTHLEKTMREIDAIVAEFHALLPLTAAIAVGIAYARYSSRFQDSIADQIRAIFQYAVANKIFIPREFVFFDMAQRGGKSRRPGLEQLQNILKTGKVRVFIAFATSRLFRKNYRAQQFVEEQLVDRGLRGIFVKSNIDTNDPDWRLKFQLLSAVDEAYTSVFSGHIRAGQEGLFIAGKVCTSLPLGFTGEEIPGEFTKRKLPRRKIIVDPLASTWIVKIFHWYVVEGKSRNQIAQELNDDPSAPAPAKSLTGLWTPRLVTQHLKNPRYIGYWLYGEYENKWLNNKDRTEQIRRDAPLRTGQFEHLRIISNETWHEAQRLIATEIKNTGRKAKDGDRKSRPLVLRRLFQCPEHDLSLVAGGAYGRSLVCLQCAAIKREKRPLFTFLNRKLANRLTCEKLAELIRADDFLVDAIIEACQRDAHAIQQPDPMELARLRSQIEKVSGKIAFNQRNPGDTEAEQAETAKVLKQLRTERAKLMADLSVLEANQSRIIKLPTRDDVIAMLTDLGDILSNAAKGSQSEDEMRLARRVIDAITGGSIQLYQMGERKAYGGWLQGRFTVRLLSFCIERLTGIRPSEADDGIEVVIDYKEPAAINAESERAKQLYDEGIMNAEIGIIMKCGRSKVTKLIKHWFESRGLTMPDGRSRRGALEKKHLEAPLYQQIADEVKTLADSGLLLQEIAEQLDLDRNTITSAMRHWYNSRGLTMPDGRTRRKQLTRKVSTKDDSGPPSHP